jgi:hypothetical protein
MSIQIRVVGLVMSSIVASAASAQTAVEWKVSEGGNGHWYRLVVPANRVNIDQALSACRAAGGDLVSISSFTENSFVFEIARQDPALWTLVWPGATQISGPWIGARFVAPNWLWTDGSPWGFTAWSLNNPNYMDEEHAVLYMGDAGGPPTALWNNIQPAYLNWGYIIEWSADCNGDGIVDYGQILRGELDDDNANGIPDVCETSVTGVIPPSVPSQGGATVTIKGANFPDHPTVLIGGVAATDVVRLSATRITATSPALLPGMASISVNGFTLPEALYIRPECGSDLDQNGTVDAGDISIILLDFGPCYEPPAALAAPTPTPLLADEPAQKPVHR